MLAHGEDVTVSQLSFRGSRQSSGACEPGAAGMEAAAEASMSSSSGTSRAGSGAVAGDASASARRPDWTLGQIAAPVARDLRSNECPRQTIIFLPYRGSVADIGVRKGA
jgi:hypothetical protein